MKNPFAYIKHLMKDPVNTIEEANGRKKEILPWFYGCLGVLVLGVVLSVLEVDTTGLVGTIGLFAAGFFAFLLLVIQDLKEKFEALTCDKCNTLTTKLSAEDFHKYVSFTVEKDEAVFKGYVGNKEPTSGVYSLVKFVGSSSAVASVDFTCPHCGEVKRLIYSMEPFKCHAEATKVGALAYPSVRASLETAVRTAINDYNDPERRHLVPYSLHSSKNPNYEARFTMKGANAPGAHPDYMGARIDKRVDVEDMLEQCFVVPMLDGTLVDPKKPKKAFIKRLIGALKP